MVVVLFQLFFLLCVYSIGNHAVPLATKTHKVFYIMGSDGIYVINPETKILEKKITNKSSPGLCTKSNNRYSRANCSFSRASVVNKQQLYVADTAGSSVKVVDLTTQKKTETIHTDPSPYGLYNLPWLKEVWVHSWKNSTFDVINTDSRKRTHNAVRAHIKPGWTHGKLLVQKDLLNGYTGYVSHLWNPGVHKIDLKTKEYSSFINMTSQGCIGTFGIVYSPINKHLFIQCVKKMGSSIVQMQVPNGKMTSNEILGSPYVSPDGRYIIMLHAPVNETVNKLLDSKVNVLEVATNTKYPELLIPGGVSHLVFYAKKSGSYHVFVTLKYTNQIAIVDIDLAKNGGNMSVSYIEDVGYTNTGTHAASRGIYSGGKWIVSPASMSKIVVVIDAETRKVHGKVSDVNGGRFGVWVDDVAGNDDNGGSGFNTARMMVLNGIMAVLCLLIVNKM